MGERGCGMSTENNNTMLQKNRFYPKPDRNKIKVGGSVWFNLCVENEQGQKSWQTIKSKVRRRYDNSFALTFTIDGIEKWATFPKDVLYTYKKDAESDARNEVRKRLFDQTK